MFKVVEDNQRPSGEIISLNSARFFASFYVLIFHIHYFSGLRVNVYIHNIIASGYLAVDFFFVLSGFIIAYNYFEIFNEDFKSYKMFIVKRLARIYPVHLITTLFALVLLLIIKAFGEEFYQDSTNFRDLIYKIFLIDAWIGSDQLTYNQPSWSISAEFFVYCLFPGFLYVTIFLGKIRSLLISCSLFLFAFYLFFMNGTILTLYDSYTTLPRVSLEFFIGVSLFHFYKQYSYQGNKLTASLVIATLMLLSLALGSKFNFLFILCSTALIYCLAEMNRSYEPQYLGGKLIYYLGKASYSLYMIHYCVIILIMHLIYEIFAGLSWDENTSIYIRLATMCMTGICSFVGAYFLYEFIETPSRRWIIRKFQQDQ